MAVRHMEERGRARTRQGTTDDGTADDEDKKLDTGDRGIRLKYSLLQRVRAWDSDDWDQGEHCQKPKEVPDKRQCAQVVVDLRKGPPHMSKDVSQSASLRKRRRAMPPSLMVAEART